MKIKALTIKVEFLSEQKKTKPTNNTSYKRQKIGVIELIKKVRLKVKGF